MNARGIAVVLALASGCAGSDSSDPAGEPAHHAPSRSLESGPEHHSPLEHLALADLRSTGPAERPEAGLPLGNGRMGTMVWTETGQVPIESIQAGDRVVAQNPTTGEVALKPVISSTPAVRSVTARGSRDPRASRLPG